MDPRFKVQFSRAQGGWRYRIVLDHEYVVATDWRVWATKQSAFIAASEQIQTWWDRLQDDGVTWHNR